MRKALISLIRFYQKHVSPAFPKCCRYSPSCSHYGIEAIEKHGAFKGSLLTIWRILRCNPFSKGGYDPVPEPKCKGVATTVEVESVAGEDAVAVDISPSTTVLDDADTSDRFNIEEDI